MTKISSDRKSGKREIGLNVKKLTNLFVSTGTQHTKGYYVRRGEILQKFGRECLHFELQKNVNVRGKGFIVVLRNKLEDRKSVLIMSPMTRTLLIFVYREVNVGGSESVYRMFSFLGITNDTIKQISLTQLDACIKNF